MDLEFKTVLIGAHTGYGNASRLLLDHLIGRGVDIREDANIKFNFCMPPDYEFGTHTIGYTPWESTEVPNNWIAGLRGVDDLWATSSWVADIFKQYTKGRDVFVLPHGIDSCWTAKRRVHRSGAFRFLHVGEPAIRKGGDIVLEAWHRGFSHRRDVKLVYKSVGAPWCRVKDKRGSIIIAPKNHPSIEVHDRIMTQEELLNLYYGCHALLYPSRGEGFGLIPLEAMATGMPTVIPSQGGLRDFSKYAAETLDNSTWVPSHNDLIHPGLWMDHDVDELIDKMEMIVGDYASYTQKAFDLTDEIHKTYNWTKIATKAIQRISKFS